MIGATTAALQLQKKTVVVFLSNSCYRLFKSMLSVAALAFTLDAIIMTKQHLSMACH